MTNQMIELLAHAADLARDFDADDRALPLHDQIILALDMIIDDAHDCDPDDDTYPHILPESELIDFRDAFADACSFID